MPGWFRRTLHAWMSATTNESHGSRLFWLSVLHGTLHALGSAGMRNTPATIVVVDDDLETTTFLCDFFTMLGMTVVPCHTDSLALACVAEHHPTIVILDYRLATMTGVDVLHQLRSDPTTQAIPVVFFTGSTDALRQQLPDLATHNAYVVGKPDVEKLNVVVHQLVQPSREPRVDVVH